MGGEKGMAFRPTRRGKRQRFLLLGLAVSFLFLSDVPLHAKSIFQTVEEKKAFDSKTETVTARSDIKPVKSTPAVDPLTLLGERPKTLAQAIQIPPEYGRISETYEGNPLPLIIHIQDVHVHYEAQKNLANILGQLVKEHGLRLILVEGGSGDTSLSFLRTEATPERRLEVAEKYLKLGKISGEEYLDIVSDKPITLWGIENEALYDQNLGIFFKVDGIKAKSLEKARALEAIADTLKVDIYSPEIKALERKKEEYDKGKIQAVEYYQYLGDLARRYSIPLFQYPNFDNFLQASLLEKSINFEKVDGQHQALIGKLTQVLSKEELTLLAEKGLKYKMNETGPGEYYGFLKEVLQKNDPAPGSHGDLDRYIDYVILYAGRDHVELFREGRVLEKEIKSHLYTSPDEQELSELSDRLDLLLSFLELNLSPDDLETYQANRQTFLVQTWKPFLIEKMNQYHVTLSFPQDTAVIDDNLELLESFYKVGMKRDEALVANTLSKVREEGVDLAVLIAGGFHTAQITKLLKEQNLSYMVIAPKITEASDLELYHKILKEKAGPAGENLRQIPALKRGATGLIRGELDGRRAQDGGKREFFEGIRNLLQSNSRFLFKDETLPHVNQSPIPEGMKTLVVQIGERDADFYAGSFLSGLRGRKNDFRHLQISREVAFGEDQKGLEALEKEIRASPFDIVFLPLHLFPLENAVRRAVSEWNESPLGVFYQSSELFDKPGIIVPYTNNIADIKEKGIKSHKSQLLRVPYDEMARARGRENGLYLGVQNAEIFPLAYLKGGTYRFLPNRPLIWGSGKFQEMRRKGTPIIAIITHPDDVAVLMGATAHLAAKAGVKIRIFVLSPSTGAAIPGVEDRGDIADIRAKEEIKSGRVLDLPEPNLLGHQLYKAHPDWSDAQIVEEGGRLLESHLEDFLMGHFGGNLKGKEVVFFLNSRNDPHPSHRAVYHEGIQAIRSYSTRHKETGIYLPFLPPPEIEDFNAIYPFETALEVRSGDPEIEKRAKAARYRARQMASIGMEIVMRGEGEKGGKGKIPPFHPPWAEAFRVEFLGERENAFDGSERVYAENDIFADFEGTVVSEEIPYREWVKKTGVDPAWVDEEHRRRLDEVRENPGEASWQAYLNMYARLLRTDDFEEMSKRYSLNPRFVEWVKAFKRRGGHEQVRLTILTRSFAPAARLFFEREDIRESLKALGVEVREVIGAEPEADENGLITGVLHTVYRKKPLIPEGHYFLGDDHETEEFGEGEEIHFANLTHWDPSAGTLTAPEGGSRMREIRNINTRIRALELEGEELRSKEITPEIEKRLWDIQEEIMELINERYDLTPDAEDGGNRVARVEAIITSLEELAREEKGGVAQNRLSAIRDERKQLFGEAGQLIEEEKKDAGNIDRIRELDDLRLRVANARDGLTGEARDGGYRGPRKYKKPKRYEAERYLHTRIKELRRSISSHESSFARLNPHERRSERGEELASALSDLRRQLRELRRSAKDGAYKILGDPRNIFGLERAGAIGDEVVFDAREGLIVILQGARITGRSYIQATKDHAVELGVDSAVDSSFVSGAVVGDRAIVSHAVLETTGKPGKFEDWSFDRKDFSGKREYTVSGSQTRVGPEARVNGARLVNTTVGLRTEIESGVYQNSEIGKENRLLHTKMTLVHTEDDVSIEGSHELPIEVSEAWLGHGYRLNAQAFIDSVLHRNRIVSLRFDGRRFHLRKTFNLPAIAHIGRNVVDSSYLGTLNPLKAHKHGLYEEFKEEEMIQIVPRDPKTLLPPIRIRGIDGSESSAHGYLLVDPLSILGPYLRWIALAGGQPSSDPLTLMANRNLTHATPFSMIGSPVRRKPAWDDWGVALPGAAKFGLSRKATSVPFLFTESPDTVFALMQEMIDALPDEKKPEVDDFPVEMLETGKALVEAELAEERAKFTDDQDPERIALLEKWREAYRLHIDSGAWRYQNGTKDSRWKFENGTWTHEALDLKRIASLEGISASDYRQTLFKDLPENDPKIPRDRVPDYEPILTEAHLPGTFEPTKGERRVNPLEEFGAIADIDPTAIIGDQVEIEEEAIIGPEVILEGKTVIRKGAQIFGSHLIDTVVGEETFIWGSRIKQAAIGKKENLVRMWIDSTDRNVSQLGDEVRLRMGRVENSFIGDRTEGSLFLSRFSNIGRDHLLEPYATVFRSHFDDSVAGVNRGIGALHVNVIASGLYTNHHLASRALNLIARPITFKVKGETKTVANAPNWGGGSTVILDRPDSTGRIILETTFIGTNTVFEVEDGKETHLGFGSIVAQRVKAGERLIHFTRKVGPGPENDIIGDVLLRPEVVLRHILSKTKSATKNPLDVDLLMEAKIQEALEQAQEELAMVRAGHTHHPELGHKLHTEAQLQKGIELFEENLDGRWRMENHRFVNGFWLFNGERYSWNVEHEFGVTDAVSGGKISYVADIGKGREGQESRVLVHPVRVGKVEGDLIAVIDGHRDEQAAHLIKQRLPSLFEAAVREHGENMMEVHRATDRALRKLTDQMESGATAAVAFIRKKGDQRKVSGFGRGDAWFMIADQGEIRLTTPEQNSALDEKGRNIVLSKGGIYHETLQAFERAEGVDPSWRFTNSYGDRKIRPYLREEAWFLEGELPLGDQSVVLAGDDGIAYDLNGQRRWLAEQIAGWADHGEPAKLILSRRNDRLSEETEVASHREWKDNRALVVYQPEPIRVRDGAERYVAKTPEWLTTYEPLHRRPVSPAMREASERLKETGEAFILVFPSSLLKEDMGESFSWALDRLARETGNSLNNEESVFKHVLLIEDPTVTMQEVENYLARFHLRRDQFYAVITYDILENYGDAKESARYQNDPPLQYRFQIEEFLWVNLLQDNLKLRLGENSNLVIVSSEDQMKAWERYLRAKRLRISNPGIRLVVFEPRKGGDDRYLNLAPLLVNTAAEFVSTADPQKALEDIKSFLTILTHKIYVDPVPVIPDYFEAYVDYLNKV